jgi:hypothetical protein
MYHSSMRATSPCPSNNVRFVTLNDSFSWRWSETEPTRYVGHCWPIVPAPDDG